MILFRASSLPPGAIGGAAGGAIGGAAGGAIGGVAGGAEGGAEGGVAGGAEGSASRRRCWDARSFCSWLLPSYGLSGRLFGRGSEDSGDNNVDA
jgi:hypothetical protein